MITKRQKSEILESAKRFYNLCRLYTVNQGDLKEVVIYEDEDGIGVVLHNEEPDEDEEEEED